MDEDWKIVNIQVSYSVWNDIDAIAHRDVRDPAWDDVHYSLLYGMEWPIERQLYDQLYKGIRDEG